MFIIIIFRAMQRLYCAECINAFTMYKVTFGKVDQFHFWCLLTSTLIEFFSYCFVFAECCLETIWFLEQTKRTDIFLMSWPKYGKLCFSPIDSDELRSLLSPYVSVIAFFDDYINPHSRQAYNWWPQVKQRLMLIKTETKREAKEHIASQSKHDQCMGLQHDKKGYSWTVQIGAF